MLTADLAVLGQVQNLAEQILERCDRLDLLVLNAGVVRPRRELTVEGLEVTANAADPGFVRTALGRDTTGALRDVPESDAPVPGQP
jgi:NADP-dependent 3-hydroxy acid dehydrogenase YdfG